MEKYADNATYVMRENAHMNTGRSTGLSLLIVFYSKIFILNFGL